MDSDFYASNWWLRDARPSWGINIGNAVLRHTIRARALYVHEVNDAQSIGSTLDYYFTFQTLLQYVV